MKQYLLYGHSGSKNHGCEALVRSTVKVLNDFNVTKIVKLVSQHPEEDYKYAINELCSVFEDYKKEKTLKISFDFIKAYFLLKVKNDYSYMDYISENAILNVNKNDIALSIGGDTYCYKGTKRYIEYNKKWKALGLKTVLWGCSIEPDLLTNKDIADDIKSFDLITARESISYNALKQVNSNTVLVSDSAFLLDKVELELPKGLNNNFVGINASPLIESNESITGITRENYCNLIEHIIYNTDMHILLIPHVIWEKNDDREILNYFYNKYKHTNKIYILDDHNCEELKGYISRCRFFVGARTHATIAAYSNYVPTLTVGYSVKAKGIAKDLFGTYKNYVIPVQALSNKSDLLQAFLWLEKNETNIRQHLCKIMSEYKNRISSGINELLKL